MPSDPMVARDRNRALDKTRNFGNLNCGIACAVLPAEFDA